MIRTSLALLASLVSLPLAAWAQAQPAPQPSAASAPAPKAADPSVEKIPLRLTQAVSRGIENNLQLEVERYDPLIAFEDQQGAWGSFDPKSQLDWDYLSQTDPVSSNSLFGDQRSRHKENKAGLGIEAMLPYVGATLGVDLNINETRDIGNRFVSQRPVYDSGFTVRGSLPLLKGLIWNEPWTRVKTSAAAYDGSRENFRADLMNVVQFIETAYWDLVAQSQAVRVARKSLETARSLLDQTHTQYEVGVKSKVEVVEAEAGVAGREFDLIRAVNRHQKAQDDLIDAVFGARLTAGSRISIEPADDPENYVSYDINTEEAAKQALAKRPELAEAQAAIEQQQLQLKFAKNQRLPQLDLRASYGASGRRGEGVYAEGFGSPFLGETTGDNVGETFNDYWTNRGGEDLLVGAVFSIPLGNISARHNVSKSALALRKAKSQLTQLRQNIILQVREASRNLTSAQEGIEAAERRRIAAAEQLRAEQVRLEYGESTPFKVLEKEQDLVEAENEKIAALFQYRKSEIDLHRAQGTILEARKIVVDQAAALR